MSYVHPLPPVDDDEEWLRYTLFRDIIESIEFHEGMSFLDVGAGHGTLVDYLADLRCDVVGIEPSPNYPFHYLIEKKGFHRWVEENRHEKFDVVTMINVLEHLSDPDETMKMAWKALVHGGYFVARVPNDGTWLQKALMKGDYWVCPDHLQYYGIKSISEAVKKAGFKICNVFVDFPMEIFCFLGMDYLKNPEVGAQCHAARKKVEMNIDTKNRREAYKVFKALGIGRNVTVVGRKMSS